MLSLLVGTRFQVLFHSPFGVLFTFPSRYLFAIGHMLVFSLRGWAPYLHSKFLVFTATCPHNIFSFAYKTVTFFGSSSQMILLKNIFLTGLGCFLFARRYLENRVFFLFLLLLRCFSSQACRFHACPPGMQVCPFGNPGISDYVHLLPAYRSLSRPSSAVAA